MRATYIRFQPLVQVVLGDLTRTLETPANDDVHPALNAAQHIWPCLAQRRHELQRALVYLVVFPAHRLVVPVLAL